jgi:hypothetical protein
MKFVKRANKAVIVFHEQPIDKWRGHNTSASLLRLFKWARGRGFSPEGLPATFGDSEWGKGGDMLWQGSVSREVWGELIRESLRWGRQTQKGILKDAKTMSYREYARKWRAKFWKGRKVIYRAAKEGPTERVVMNKIRSERTGLVVTQPNEVREEVYRGFSTELPYKMSVPIDKQEGPDPLAEGPGLGRHYTGPGRGLGHRFVSELFYDVLHYLPEGKAAGPDGIPNDIIKRMPKEFHDLLFRIMKTIWEGHGKGVRWRFYIKRGMQRSLKTGGP